MSTPAFDEDRCKAYDVFAGDFGSPGDRLLQDSIVTAAKTHKLRCHTCGGVILKGERHRVRTEIVDGELMAYRWCGLCCVAMARSWDDEGHEIDERTLLHPAMSHLRIEKDYREHSQEHHAAVARIVAEIARALQAADWMHQQQPTTLREDSSTCAPAAVAQLSA